jgi:hypothetical protein
MSSFSSIYFANALFLLPFSLLFSDGFLFLSLVESQDTPLGSQDGYFPLGWVNFNLFTFDGRLRAGAYTLRMWPDQVIQRPLARFVGVLWLTCDLRFHFISFHFIFFCVGFLVEFAFVFSLVIYFVPFVGMQSTGNNCGVYQPIIHSAFHYDSTE